MWICGGWTCACGHHRVASNCIHLPTFCGDGWNDGGNFCGGVWICGDGFCGWPDGWNVCGFCVKMHTREARQDGETNDRLDRLVVWAHVSDFSEAEKAALAWTEALTLLDPKTDYASLRSRLRQSFSDEEIGALTATIGMINLWNRIQVSAH